MLVKVLVETKELVKELVREPAKELMLEEKQLMQEIL